MNYRMTQEFKPPFRINALIEEAGSLKVVYVIMPCGMVLVFMFGFI